MNINKYQNRREFLISSTRKGLMTGLGFIGISLGNKSPESGYGEKCPLNLTCRDCSKMGVCLENKAVEMRKEIKTNGHTAKISKGTNHG